MNYVASESFFGWWCSSMYKELYACAIASQSNEAKSDFYASLSCAPTPHMSL